MTRPEAMVNYDRPLARLTRQELEAAVPVEATELDEILELHFRDPLDAARSALDLVNEADEAELPRAHAGAHSGPLIERDGDYFGRTVNIASRLSAAAAPGQVLVSADIAAEESPDLRFIPLGERELKGIGSVRLFEAVRAT